MCSHITALPKILWEPREKYDIIPEEWTKFHNKCEGIWMAKLKDNEIHNDEMVALKGLKYRGGTVILSHVPYLRHRICNNVWTLYVPKEDQHTLLKESDSFFSTSFGVNMVIITSDNQLVLLKRIQEIEEGKGLWSNPVAYGIQYQETFSSTYHETTALLRDQALKGMEKTLGLLSDNVDTMEYFSIILKKDVYEYVATGAIRLKCSSEAIQRKWKTGTELQWKYSQLKFISLERDAINQFAETESMYIAPATWHSIACSLESNTINPL